MPIGKALLLKGLGGFAVLGSTIGGSYFTYDYLNNRATRFDRGLIEFLKADDSTNIQFSVKKVDGSEIDNNTFQNFSDTSITATIKVTVDASASTGGNNDGTLTEKSGAEEGSKAKKSYLQELNGDGTNGGKAWTWVCEIKFTKKTEDTTATELKDKDKLVKANDGFFNKLKDEDSNNNNKDLKIKFIKDCAAARGITENRKINKLGNLASTTPTANEIKSTKEFKLRKGDSTSGEEATKLYPVDQSDFDHWFKNEGN